jgi:acetyltransferase-like isoleucine patch superfamily enzyme
VIGANVAFLAEKDLVALGFRHLGRNVRISDKASIYEPRQMEIGDNSRIDDFCVLSGRVVIGRNVHIAVFCNVAGGEEGAYLEDFSGLSYGCHLIAQSDDYSGQSLTNPTVPDKYKIEKKAAVYLRKHVIVGSCSVVLPGVTLAEGTSIGAMSLVTRSTRPWSIYCGIPARHLKARRNDLLTLEQDYLREA